MSQNNNTNTTTTRADLERQWTAQRCPGFVVPHPERVGGMARFNSGVGMIFRAIITMVCDT